VPTLLIENFSCEGPLLFYAGDEHVVEVTIKPQAVVFGLPVASQGAAELTFSQ
jgi:hypothetical protein